MSNVKLAIRVRPFTERELKSEKDRIPVVNILDEHTVTITNIKVSLSGAGDSRERIRRYTADYTFDSACAASDPTYASQEKVFETIGREVVASVSGGASVCVLAYGQSATGKTHTMMGTTDQPGLVPRLCRTFAEKSFDITVSFLEIYNERVHDLLAGEPLACHSLPRRLGNARKDLRVREHPDRGPYVQNLRRVAVTDVENLLSLVEEGARRRQTAATRRNSTSSRSHALLELATPNSTLHLADLAGSEKASWEGCGGGRQKEGANINKSLVALSNVISALVSGGSRGRFVPYRDSALTWLLKDCFTGGATTFIIATVSPSVACYGESASTLRWAERARQLRKPRVLTCGPSTASRAALQAQLNHLLAELTRHHIQYNLLTGKITYGEHHWNQQGNVKNVQLNEVLNTEAKIGNLLNMLKPKTEAQNSESTASSVASGSSEVINMIDKDVNINEEISKEVDKLLTPALGRARSGSEIEIMPPLRHKRRHYKSQEVLSMNKSLQVLNLNVTEPSTSRSQKDINETQANDNLKPPHVPILYDNQRAEIVASVTERLYSKLKKKEEAAVSKVETMVDRKIMEPLSELRICTNARQRLMELSQKAMRNKRRIGIPAHTQTRAKVTRVRDQGIDIQTDLVAYVLRKEPCLILKRDVGTETIPMTPRCKETAVGPKCGSLDFRDTATATETKQIIHRNSFMMTDIVAKHDRCSQTPIMPPPRRKRRVAKCSDSVERNEYRCCCSEACSGPSVIRINISQQYPVDSESQSSDENVEQTSSEDNLQGTDEPSQPTNVSTTPDLLTNHNNIDTTALKDSVLDPAHENTCPNVNINLTEQISTLFLSELPQKDDEEFPTDCLEEFVLPRVTVTSTKVVNQAELKDMILGRNEDVHPYNIILSPPKERDNAKRTVKFRDEDVASAVSVASQTNFSSNSNISSDTSCSEKECNDNSCSKDSLATCSNSTESKFETGSFVWQRYNPNNSYKKTVERSYSPVFKSNSKYRNAKTKLYKDFLGLESVDKGKRTIGAQRSSLVNVNDLSSGESTENDISQYKFRQKRQFFEEKFGRDLREGSLNSKFDFFEKKLLDSCKSLDTSVNKYDNYLASYHVHNRNYENSEGTVRRPKEYLNHLVELRRKMVRTESRGTERSCGIVNHF